MKTLFILLAAFLIISCNKTENKNKTNTDVIGRGKITTIADGFDVKRVNLWSSISTGRKIVAYMTNGEEVLILKDVDPYYLVESVKSDGRKGYCMKGFVVLNK